MPGEDGLVIGAIARIPSGSGAAFDIGRKRHRAHALKRRAERGSLAIEAEREIAFLVLDRDLGRDALAEIEPVAGPEPLRALGEGAPFAAAEIAMQGYLDPRRAALPDEP